MIDAHPTLTARVPACFLARLETRGFAAPYDVDPKNPKMVVDGGGRSVGIVAPITLSSEPTLDHEFAAFVAGALNQLDAEARAARDPLDPPHVEAVTEEGRRTLARLNRPRPEAAE